MLTRPEAGDPAVEELKRRARRRLVGAIVLALAAAVILPLLLESDPKPLGDDVSIQIPPIDSGKFITPLSPPKGADTKASPDRAGTLTSAKPVLVAPDSPVEAKPAAALNAGDTPVESAQRAPDVAPSAGPTATSMINAAEPQKPVASASKAEPGDNRPDGVSPAGGFVVQLAAFADAKAAPTLASKLKSSGFPAYTETLKTNQGTMRRVRVGPYATREVADAELAKLNAAGYRGVVTSR
ncbi:MAG TPA: SPOR domain-containing protein [Casimicrobiaceae bacterium]|jgi:DedD protein|nr:SPOR domain-containing protein [Casimicrobiaceae bacterium]